MSRPIHSTLSVLSVLLLIILLLPACSDDGPTNPIDDPNDDTPDLPTVSSPSDQLPEVSSYLVRERATLSNFSPDLSGAAAEMLDALNEAQAIDFRLPAGRYLIVDDGQPCYPASLQWSFNGYWYDLIRTAVPDPFSYLGTYGGSHYYLCTSVARWYFADLNCRAFGGHLVSLTSADESDFVFLAAQAALPGTSFQIGLTDWGRANGDWVWTSGETYDWSNWYPGEPNNSGGEFFGHTTTDGRWNDSNSSIRLRWVLERSEPLPDLGDEPIPCATYGGDLIFLNDLASPTVMPHIERRVYWKKVFQTTLDPRGTYERSHSYTYGTSETTGMSFGWSIGISTSASWGFASVEIETEFHQDFSHEVTISSEETFTDTYSGDAPDDKSMMLALWQLRERFVIVDSEGNDWSDPRFELNGPLPVLDQGLKQDYLQTQLFNPPGK